MKRVSDLNDEECLIVYKKLSLDQKRAALIPFRGEEAQVYTDPALVRDILEKYVLPRLDLVTRARLKQTCTYYNERIEVVPYSRLREIRAAYVDGLCRPVLDLFFPFLRRFLIMCGFRHKLPDIAKFKIFLHRVKTFHVSSDCIVHYPSGVVCKNGLKYPRGHIFASDFSSFMRPNGKLISLKRFGNGKRYGLLSPQQHYAHLADVIEKYKKV